MTGLARHVPIAVGVLTLLWGVVAHGSFPSGPSIAWVSWVVLMFHFQGRVNELLVLRAIEQQKEVERIVAPVIPWSLACRYYSVLAAPLVVGVIDWLDVIPY